MIINDFFQPGLYRIRCLVTNKIYIGESGNVIDRLSKHYKGNHDCSALQQDWNNYGFSHFEFEILDIGTGWEDKKIRKEKERELIESCTLPIYNTSAKKISRQNYKIICQIYGVTYQSIGEAVVQTKLSETAIRRNLRDPNNKDFVIIEKVIINTKRVSVYGKIYPSVKSIIEAGVDGVKTRHQVYYKIKTNKDWFYI
uniref:Putative GIY YIG homing endonuclease n=1 Tax=Oogamochlamys gigantea TaxID=158507 RepID=A0A0S2LN63_9CHLO|nr:putative GIY YIG homing endonuclease [Oogamochlamys gigantea]ALO62836.1 putative GIY YIG homing endonuclease [Oogamochlamys gigantea]